MVQLRKISGNAVEHENIIKFVKKLTRSVVKAERKVQINKTGNMYKKLVLNLCQAP